MTDLQRRFAEEYVIDYHITYAGKRAGIQGDNINITAWKMLQLPDVQQYVTELQDQASVRAQISKDKWVAELAKVGFSNIKNYMSDDLEVKPLSTVKDAEAIKSIKKTVIESEFGSKTTVEFALHDKIAGLVNIGRHLGFYEKDNDQQKAENILPTINVYNTAPPLATDEKQVNV